MYEYVISYLKLSIGLLKYFVIAYETTTKYIQFFYILQLLLPLFKFVYFARALPYMLF